MNCGSKASKASGILGVVALLAGIGMLSAVLTPSRAAGDEYRVYSVYQALNLGNPGEVPQKDFYVNIGGSEGVREGTVLEVLRRVPTYDLVSEKLFKEMVFPIARLRVIHVESSTAVARLQKMFPPDKTPAISPRAVMVGDLVRIAQ